MSANWTSVSIQDAILLYLYGTTEPGDFESRLRPNADPAQAITIDTSSFMDDGPGRYVTPANFGVADKFFDGSLAIPDGQYNSVADLYAAMGLDAPTSLTLRLSQYGLDENSADYAQRAFIWGTSGYTIAEASFSVVNGIRTITKFDISVNSEDFNFEGGPNTTVVNQVLHELVDPYDIGITVPVSYTGDPKSFTNYSQSDFASDASNYANISHGTAQFLLDLLYNQSGPFVTGLESNPLTSFYEDGRHVVYGDRHDGDLLFYNPSDDSLGGDGGVVLVGGGGDDDLTGTDAGDILLGGNDNDTLRGSIDIALGGADDKISDRLEGGSGFDTYQIGSNYTDYGVNQKNPFYGVSSDLRSTAWYILGLKYIDTIYDTDGSGQISVNFTINGEVFDQNFSLNGYDDFVAIPQDDRSNARYDAHEVLGPGTGTWQINTGAVTGVIEITARDGDGNLATYEILQAGYGALNPAYHNPLVAIEIGAVAQQRSLTSDPKFFFVGAEINDAQTGGGADDELYGEGGNDQLGGGDGSDYIDGGDGNDTLHGDGGDDVLVGGAGDNILMGGVGNDILITGDGADQLYGGDGDDYVYADANDTVLSGGDGYDTLVLKGNTNFILNLADIGFEEVYSGDGDDSLTGTILEDVIFGGGGNDTIHGGAASDWLEGEGSNDSIFGEDGDDRLIGGRGDDYLTGGTGNDTYSYSRGDGNDTIIGNPGEGDEDRLFLSDLTVSEIEVQRVGDDVRIVIAESQAGAGGAVLLQGGYSDGGVESVMFADGTTWSHADLIAHIGGPTSPPATVSGTSGVDHIGTEETPYALSNMRFDLGQGDDILYADYVSGETIVYRSGDGNDTYRLWGPDASTNTLELHNINPDDLTLHRVGVDLALIDNTTGQTVTLSQHFIAENFGLNQITFDTGAVWDRDRIEQEIETVHGTSGNDQVGTSAEPFTLSDVKIDLGLGNDYLYADYVSGDTILYSSGDGNDTYRFWDGSASTTTLELTDISSTDVTLGRDDLNLTVTDNLTGQVISLTDHFIAENFGLQQIQFSDNVTWDRTKIETEANTFHGTAGNDQVGTPTAPFTLSDIRIDLGAGDDTLYADYVAGDTVVYNTGDGNDTYRFWGTSASNITLDLTDIDDDDVILGRVGNDLTLEDGNTGQVVTFTDHFIAENFGLGQIAFNGGTVWTRSSFDAPFV
jgi:Ca2+-binding RTX toxin-like protein